MKLQLTVLDLIILDDVRAAIGTKSTFSAFVNSMNRKSIKERNKFVRQCKWLMRTLRPLLDVKIEATIDEVPDAP